MAFLSYKQTSKANWGRQEDSKQPSTNEEIGTGALQRIADATEAMAQNFIALQSERDMYKRKFESEAAACNRLNRSNNALRGHIKRLKKKNA